MLLITHILIATFGLVLSTLVLFKPSEKVIQANYLTASATLFSGIALILLHPLNIAKTCLTGIAYFSFVTAAIYIANRRLQAEFVRIKKG